MTRIAFLGSPEVATIPLRALVAAGHEIGPVITKIDKRRGRNESTSATPVKRVAQELGLGISEKLDIEGADLAVVAAFGRLIPEPVLEQAEFLNIHPSLLPRWRGAAPVERALLAGDAHTGVCLMSLVNEMDAGPIYRRAETDIGRHETAAQLLERLFTLGTEMLIDELAVGLGTPQQQVGEPTHAAKLTSDDLHLDWQGMSAAELDRIVRVGRAWTIFRGKRLLVLEAEPAEHSALTPGEIAGTAVGSTAGELRLVCVQPEGKGPVDAKAWLNGARVTTGERLGSTP